MTIARAAMSVCYPSRVMLAAAMKPCPCGYFGDPQRSCSCGPLVVTRYRVSGPLLDRIDLHVDVPAVPHRELSWGRSGDLTATEDAEALRNGFPHPAPYEADPGLSVGGYEQKAKSRG